MSNPHVLVVDDEADIRASIQDILSDESYGVTVAANATEARQAREKRKFDLVLLDIWMPDTDGITLLREWSDESELNCPVVIMSGHGTVDTAVEATRLGVASDKRDMAICVIVFSTQTLFQGPYRIVISSC